MSAVILLVVVVAWVVVMVPYLLHRHDQVTESRSVDDFEKTMRVLSRRSQTVEASRQVVVPRRSGGSTAVTVTVNGTTRLADGPASARAALLRTRAALHAPVETAAPPAEQSSVEASEAVSYDQPSQDQPKSQRRSRFQRRTQTVADPRTRQQHRRRRTMVVLALVAVLVVVAAVVVSPWFWIAQGIVDLGVLGCVVHVRQESARAVARRRHQAELIRRAREREAAPAPSYAQAVPAPAYLSADRGEVVIEKQPDGSWTPIPVPVPTYVTAPRAPERPVARTPVETEAEVRPERRKAAGE